MSRPVLSVDSLSVQFAGQGGSTRVVRDVSLKLGQGEKVGLVGESGSGKTMTALSIMGLLPRGASVASGSITYRNQDLLNASHETLRSVRGSEIAMIFQEPSTSLHPTLPVGFQIAEAIRAHRTMSRAAARTEVIDLLDQVGVPNPALRVDDYPQTWSGGMRQRAVIAMAIANQPSVIIADEPTTALDVTIQAQVLELLDRLVTDSGATLLLISHDLGVVAERADRVAVMYAGSIVELDTTNLVFDAPAHPYTAGLVDSIPRISGPLVGLPFIPGRPPNPKELPTGCPFHPRCSLARDRCAVDTPELLPLRSRSERMTACFFPEDVARAPEIPPKKHSRPVSQEPLLTVEDLHVDYEGRRGATGVRAVDGVSLEVREAETLALVGESGCGKTTTARAILQLVPFTAKRMEFRGSDLSAADEIGLRRFRREVQAVFQDPYASLNPRKTVSDIVASPLRIHGIGSNAEIRERTSSLLESVGLGAELGARFPAALSGGQRQRVSIARALALDPALVVLDEPLTALDLSIQAQIINLVQDLQAEIGLSYLFIAHDLATVRHLADRVAVMYLGEVVETAARPLIYDSPRHPYTKALLASVPELNGHSTKSRSVLRGEVGDMDSEWSGCKFYDRCTFSTSECTVRPTLAEVSPGHWVSCWNPQ